MSEEYCYSTDGKLFYGREKSILDALHEGFDDPDQESVDIGRGKAVTIDLLIFDHSAERILEDIQEQAEELCGEVASDWLPSRPYARRFKEGSPEREKAERDLAEYKKDLGELTEALRLTVDKWLTDKGLQPTFYTVENIKTYSRAEYECACIQEPKCTQSNI